MSAYNQDAATLARYRTIYGLDDRVGLAQVRAHEALERELTDQLLCSTPDTRWETFERAYTRLYSELPWLNATHLDTAADARTRSWRFLVPPWAKVYEIGSGQARLLRFLRSMGAECVATEITRERGERHAAATDGLTWRHSDGIHLTRFESKGSYDCVISTQVIEHMHPDDVLTHLKEARELLKPGGRYLFDTPHPSCGPHDLSHVFNLERACYMHLREYTWLEMRNMLRAAGYSRIAAVCYIPGLSPHGIIACSRIYLQYLLLWERLEDLLALSHQTRKRLRKVLRLAVVPTNVWFSATR